MKNTTERPVVRRNGPRTRARILAAAQDIFSSRGYTQTGLRDIATEAGVDVALVSRAFGSKEKLFQAALEPRLLIERLWSEDRSQFGVNLVETLLDPVNADSNPLRMLLLSSSDPGARQIAIDLLEQKLVGPLGELMGDPDGPARAAEVLALTAGFITYRNVLPLSPFAAELRPTTRLWLARALQAIVDEGINTKI